jgi:hypothetical protein
VVITFDEAMDADTIDADTIRLHALGATSDLPAAVSYADRTVTLDPQSDLEVGTRYYVIVSGSVNDISGNPLGSDVEWSFVTDLSGTFTDASQGDFGAGTFETGAYLASTSGGEVTLAPAVGAEFNGTTLPVGWFDDPYGSGGAPAATFSNGWITLNGRKVGTTATFGPGRWLEFLGMFSTGWYEHIGFGVLFDSPPWAIFSTENTGAIFQARTAPGGADTSLGIGWSGVPHRYRIVWNAGSVDFFVDGASVASHATTIAGPMRPLAADHAGGGTVALDWLRMGPYQASGTFVSRAFDAGRTVTWTDLDAVANLPLGTAAQYETRTSINGSDWSEWAAVGSPIHSPDGRYLQYRILLSSASGDLTPEVEQVTVGFETDAPTAVTLADFAVLKRPDALRLTWVTAQEINLLGFNLYRSDSPDGNRTPLNVEIIPALDPGGLEGASYQFVDAGVSRGETVYYWLEAVSLEGSAEVAGPLEARFDFWAFLPIVQR